MQLVLEIIVRFAEILTIVAGSAGVCLSLLLIFTPGLIHRIGSALNRQVLTENQLASMNPTVTAESFVLRYHVACGGLLVASSIFILLFLFFRDPGPHSFGLVMDVAVEFSILLGKTAGLLGLAAGTLLFFSPATFKSIGRRANVWIDTQAVFTKLDTLSVDVDSFFIKYSLICGLLGLAVSAALIILSVVNFLGTATSLGGGY
jgi:hypothetical protein